MQVALSRGALVLEPNSEHNSVLPLPMPVNDLIGLRAESGYATHLFEQYHRFWPESWWPNHPDSGTRFDGAAERVEREAAVWSKQDLPTHFLAAARLAESGHFSARLAPFYERVKRRPAEEPDEVEDGDLAALAAWTLGEALRLRPVSLRECPLCRVPWLASAMEASPYCLRPYPGRQTSCRALKKDEHFRENQGAWRREYKRLYEQKKRGTLAERDWDAWRAGNSPDAWFPFPVWKERSGSSIPTSELQATAEERGGASGS